MADNVTATGKYFLISVPEFADDPVGPRQGEKMTSFLRMGAFHEAPESEDATKRALDLAQYAQHVSASQGGHLTSPYGAEVNTSDTGVENRGVFLDDQRNDDPEQLSQSERLTQSNALLTRGGWWDHSDGNRISTTYGDKVEVIRGNYKMVVLHRQDNVAGGGGWDLSGGHIQDLGPNSMPGASVRVEFRPGMFGQRGTWHLENTTNNFIQTSDYAGDFFEHWFGNLKQSTVGSENPQEWNPEKQKPYGNPHMTERVWARKIESYTGSAAWRIPEMIEETYAQTMTSKLDVSGDTYEHTTVGGSTTTTTMVGGGTLETTTVGGGTLETTTVGGSTASVTTLGGSAMDLTLIGGGTIDAAIVGGAGIEASIIGGTKAGISIVSGIDAAVSMAALRLGVDIAARAIDVRIGAKTEVITSDAQEFVLGPKLKLTLKEDEVSLQNNKIHAQQTEMATSKTQINTLYDVLAGQVILL